MTDKSDKDIETLRAAAEAGDVYAQSTLGDCFRDGLVVEKDLEEAARWYRVSAEQGWEFAQAELGDCYSIGAGVEKDLEEAARWYRAAAEQGLYRAQLSLAQCYQNGDGVEQDHEEAVRWFRLFAENADGDMDDIRAAEMELARYLSMGRGVTQDFDEARKWYCKSQSEDIELWQCFEMIFNVAEHPDVMDWIQSGIARGDAEFIHALGSCYWAGAGVERNDQLAIKWTLKAASSGYEPAKDQLFELIGILSWEESSTLTEPEELFYEVEKYLVSLAEAGDLNAPSVLGVFHQSGWHRKENPELELAQCYLGGKRVEQSYDEARNWFFKSEQPSVELVEWMAGTEELQDVMDWVHTGIENGDPESMVALAGCYYCGTGLEPNDQLALKWALKAAKLGSEVATMVVYSCVVSLWEENKPGAVETKEVNPEEVETYLCGIAEDGDAAAGFALGKFYASQWHGKENPKLAVKFYRTTTEQGTWTWQGQSRILLGRCYMEGYGVDKNPEEAFKWFLQAAEESRYWGLRDVYECYRDGIGVDKNPEEAEKWAKRYKESRGYEIDEGENHPDDMTMTRRRSNKSP